MNFLRPYKSDIHQVETLTKLGVSKTDIASVLGITIQQFEKWESKNTAISELLKPKARPEYTVSHPDYAHMIEEAFACAGKRYYRFKDEFRMSTGRYKYYYAVLRELELKLSLEHLEEYVTAFKAVLNGGNKKRIELTDLHVLVINLESRLKLAFDPATIKKLAAIAYFDDTEDLLSFDERYGAKKVALWEEHKFYDFFLTRPIGELFNANNISVDSLTERLAMDEMLIQDLRSSLLTVLEANS